MTGRSRSPDLVLLLLYMNKVPSSLPRLDLGPLYFFALPGSSAAEASQRPSERGTMGPLHRRETEAERPSCGARLTGTPFLPRARFARPVSRPGGLFTREEQSGTRTDVTGAG